ncbi:MAG TPA: HK97 family phage prohead protease, partial [Thermoflexales bacterium]|nr:HK97 family phage prohead protease [Thermoflexales bacterium]
MNDIERRVAAKLPELRSDGTDSIVGHAAMFDVLSEELWGFREKIAPGAFDDVLGDDVRALFNHDPNFVLGRTTARTLVLSVDQTGLRNEIAPPDTQWARDLLTSMKRGDITQQSFAFVVKNDSWEYNKEADTVTRTILKVERLYDVSIVTYPAYPQT